MFGSLDNVQTPDDMGAGQRRRFCDDWFGRKDRGRQQQQQQSFGGSSFGMRGRGLSYESAGGGGLVRGEMSQNSFVLRGEERRGEQVAERRVRRKRAREVVRSEGEEDDGAQNMSQVLLVREESPSAQSSVAE